MQTVESFGDFSSYVELEITRNPLFRTYTYTYTEIDGKLEPIVAFNIQPIDIDLKTQLYDEFPDTHPDWEHASEDDKTIPLESFKIVNSAMPYMNYFLANHFEIVKHIFKDFQYREVPSDPKVFRFSARHTRAPNQTMEMEM